MGDMQGQYSGYSEPGYMGDRAGITFHFREVVYGVSVRHEKHREFSTPVLTTSDLFTKETLDTRIAALEASKTPDHATLETLKMGREALAQFIQKNGATNPMEAIDWEYA